jgi:pullulanase-type alpha-1,6-glucosidase
MFVYSRHLFCPLLRAPVKLAIHALRPTPAHLKKCSGKGWNVFAIRRRKDQSRFVVFLAAIVALVGGVLPGALYAQADEQPEQVVIPGSFQAVLGCESDWQPDCALTALAYDEQDDLWSGEFTIPAGDYEYKVALDGSWDVNYGANAEPNGANIALSLAEETTVRFIYQHSSNWVTDNVNSLIANVPGNFQDEIGCGEEWAPWCLRSLLVDIDGDGIYTYSTSELPAGPYEAKVAVDESWSVNYGADGVPGGANILFVVPEDGTETVFTFDSSTNIMTISVGGASAPAVGNLFLSRAIWVSADTIAWDIARIPGATYTLHYSPTAELTLTNDGVEGGEGIELTYDRAGLPEAVLAANPQLADDYFALKISPDDLALVPDILRGQLAVSMRYNNAEVFGDATGVQIWGVLDDLYATDEPLGVQFDADGVPTLSVWAPTAQNVRLHLFMSTDAVEEPEIVDMSRSDSGVWSVTGDAGWYGRSYLYEVTVYAPAAQSVVTNLVTDPYAISLSLNSARSQIVDLDDPALMPEGWDALSKPPLEAFEDIVLYELHVRDFSIYDETVSPENRGTFRAFTEFDSNGMQHLAQLAEAGVSHVHILPAFDIATINEDASQRQEVPREELEALPPDSEQQQALLEPVRDLDGFNWGYDPLHFTVPEGSYSTQPDGPQRILEFREMVQALNRIGLRVVMDVVYNHTNASGQSDRSVFDRIVPGYYHRYNADGRVETSTCCQNTATEHAMMQRLMLDSLYTWTVDYRVDGYRFDLMGHHMRDNMLEVRALLDSLTLAEHGVDGPRVFVYGEGWDFGEVAGNARGVNATQLNMAGTGIATFNDRLRDAVRGGNPFGDWQQQGFSNGLFVFPNEVEGRTPEEQEARLNLLTDWIRIGLAGNLADYTFVSAVTGEMIAGREVDYNGNPAGYTQDPAEQIVYVSAHDNETIFDAIQMKAPLAADMDTRVRMHNLALDTMLLAQGVPFIHAGDEILRSKSLDRNSYNSGDWFNAIDWTLQGNNWGHGLPPAADNENNWPIFQPLLANPDLVATPEHIEFAYAHTLEMLRIRFSSPLFRLRTAEAVQASVRFLDDMPPGVIAMVIEDADDVDPDLDAILVVFNATPEAVTLDADQLPPGDYALHPIQQESADPIIREATLNSIPAWSTAIFVDPEGMS